MSDEQVKSNGKTISQYDHADESRLAQITGQLTGNLPGQELHMRIARDGTWYYRGTAINRMPLVKLFASVLRREDDGSYWLVTPVERGRIDVEDVPFVAVELSSEGEGRDKHLALRTNLDDWVTVGPDNPLRIAAQAGSREPCPYVMVRGGMEARLARSVYYHLVEEGVWEVHEGEERFGVWSSNRFFPLAPPPETPAAAC